MTESEARARLQSMTAWDAVPALTADEVEELLVIARRPDEDGLLPSDDEWTGTWDLRYGAAEGWRWKAAKTAGAYAFSSDGQSFSRSEMNAMCLEMARQYGKSGIVSVAVGTLAGVDTDLIGNVNCG